MFPFSSRGPREDGGFKPNLTAPGSAVSTINTWLQEPGLPDAGYTLPIGYAMENGTSMAAPEATGGAALLLSAAKQRDLGITPAALRRALYTSAKLIPATSVTAQGNGETVQVDGYAVPTGSTAYDYLDVYYSPALGTVTVPAKTVSLANGASSTITGAVTASAVPPAGRNLFGEMTVVTDEGAVVGRGSVSIGEVK